MPGERIKQAFEFSYDCLQKKISGGRIAVENEVSLQLHFAAILKSVGEILEFDDGERFSIELGKDIRSDGGESARANVDIFISYKNARSGECCSCAVEIKYFKRENHRELKNRYDVFTEIKHLEGYGPSADLCFLLIATDHQHYVSQDTYSPETGDFDLRDRAKYLAGTTLSYRTAKPYGSPITLSRSYEFKWDRSERGLNFLKLAVAPARSPKFVEIFRNAPQRWSLRGDPFLWEDMGQNLISGTDFPTTRRRFEELIEITFERLTGRSLSCDETFVVERYSHGGMSSGQIDPTFWRSTLVPMLVSRLEVFEP